MTAPKPIFNPLEMLTQLGWSESEDLEFKSAKGGLPLGVWETYSAMANTKGGIIFLGIENDGTVSGVKELHKIKKNLWDMINNRGKVSINLLENDDVQEIKYLNETLLVIHVPRASRYQRPVFVGQNPLTGTYRRNYEGDYHCTDQEVGRMLADRSDEPADSRILKYYKIDDLDPLSLSHYRQCLRSFKPTHPWLIEDDKGLLTKLGGWKLCRESGHQGVTVSGMLMFGREDVIRVALPRYSVDYREKFSDDPNMRWTDRLTMDGTWEGNLFQFYLKVIQKLGADLKIPFQLDADLFRQGETVVHEAIREALVNALIHADHFGQGGVIIEKYRDRFAFSNPGSLLISIEQLFNGNVSECRNPSLQLMFTMIGAAEKAGSGIDKIRRGWTSQHWREPIVKESVQPDRIQWILPMISLIPEESLMKLKLRFGEKIANLTKLEVQALVTADIEGSVDNVRMRQITFEHASDITRVLQKLVSKGNLLQDGQGRWTRYRLPPVADSVHMGSDSVHMGSDSVHMGSDSVHIDIDSVHIEDNTEAPNNEWDELIKLAEPARQNRRLSPGSLEAIILELCAKQWLTRKQLSELLERNSDGLRSRFLTQMVQHGFLQLRFPDKPNRVDQAYKKNFDFMSSEK